MSDLNLNNTPTQDNPAVLFRGKPLNNMAVWVPVKWLLHGTNSSGKTSLGCKETPSPFLMDFDGNSDHISAPNLHKVRIKTFDYAIETLEYLLSNDHPFKTVVVDTLDTLLDFCLVKVRGNLTGEDLKRLVAFGTDYKLCAAEMVKFRKLLDDLWEKKKMHIIILAQSKLKTVQNPMVEAYDRWEPAVNDATSRIFMDWASCVFFANKEVYFKDDLKAAEGAATKIPMKKRVMPYNKSDAVHYLYTVGNAAYCAKNTFNLPDKIPMSWKIVTELMRNNFKNGQ